MDFQKRGVVSAWVGHFAGEAEFLDYIEPTYDEDGNAHIPFQTDTGIHFDHDYQEAVFYKEPVADWAAALDGFSEIDAFRAPLADAIRAAQPSANALLLLYDYDGAGTSAAKLRFVGSFPYRRA